MFSKSKIFLYIMLSFLLGVFSASFSESLFFIFLFFSVLFICFLVFSDKRKMFLLFVFLIFSLFGFYRYEYSLPKSMLLSNDIGFFVSIEGVVYSEPESKSNTQKFILKTNNKENILIIKNKYPKYNYGDYLKVYGKLEEPKNFTNNFDYKSYLAKDDIYFLIRNPKIEKIGENKANLLKSFLFSFKNKFQENIKKALPSPESDFINGILFGTKEEIPKDLYQNFINTGTAHIIALSGFNVTIIVVFLSWIFSHFISSKKVVLFSAIFIIFLFVVMTGASPSVVRAALMGVVLLIAKYYGRAQYALNALMFAAVLMIFYNPKILVYDVSFQLSFLATFGLLYFYPYFLRVFKKMPNILKTRDTLSATLSAQLAVMPILIFNFKQLSLISPLVNILILPFIPPAMLLGFLVGLLAFFSFFMAKIVAIFLWVILSFQINVINYFGSLSFSILNF